MAIQNDIDHITALIANGNVDAPSVDPVEINLRSGVTFVFRDSQKRGVPADRQGAIRTGLGSGWLIGSFVMQWGFDVPVHLVPQFEAWLAANEPLFMVNPPTGVRYRGTYAVFSTSEKGSGAYRTTWTFDSFNAMQDFGVPISAGEPGFARLVQELAAFIDRSHGAGHSQEIYLPAQGTTSLAGLGQPFAAAPKGP